MQTASQKKSLPKGYMPKRNVRCPLQGKPRRLLRDRIYNTVLLLAEDPLER
jgi:hypothetical protein